MSRFVLSLEPRHLPPWLTMNVGRTYRTMKLKNLTSAVIGLIGLYAIYSALLIAGLPVMLLVMSFLRSSSDFRAIGLTTMMCIPQFILPLALGVFLFARASKVASWILPQSEVEDQSLPCAVSIPEVSFLLTSLLGVFMLSTTIPAALQTLAAWFQAMAADTWSMSGISSEDFWQDSFPTVVYHVSAISFAAFVLLRGKSISRFLLSLRVAGSKNAEETKGAQPVAPANPGSAG